MDVLLPNSDIARASRLYGKYHNVKEKTVSFCGADVRYYLLNGKPAELDREVYSILCVKYNDDDIEDSEFVFDVTSDITAANLIFDMITRNAVTPCCLIDAVENIIAGML